MDFNKTLFTKKKKRRVGAEQTQVLLVTGQALFETVGIYKQNKAHLKL